MKVSYSIPPVFAPPIYIPRGKPPLSSLTTAEQILFYIRSGLSFSIEIKIFFSSGNYKTDILYKPDHTIFQEARRKLPVK